MIFWILFLSLITVMLLFAWFLDRKRKKDMHRKTINPNAKPGESNNYMMGDNRYFGGGPGP
ncbi:hypothetical protein P4V29_33885 [Bacillus thuringiensis]|nr:hypothetical protein [Bacillus thuringiensis]MED1757276.1 hypothetical protein [Bacillus thuringiensis]